MNRVVLFSVLIALILISCGGEDTFAGRAYRLRAEQGLKEIRNSLAAYKISNGKYPEESTWKTDLKTYFRKERFPDPKWVTKRKMLVMSAKNNISQVKGIIQELKRKIYFADTTLQKDILKFVGPIDSVLTLSEYEVTEAVRYDYRDISPVIADLFAYTVNLKIPEEKRKIIENMEKQYKILNSEIDALQTELLVEDSIFNMSVENAFKISRDVINKGLQNVQGNIIISPESLAVHSDAIEKVILKLNPKKDTLIINKLNNLEETISYFIRGKDHIDFLNYLNELKKKLPASIRLFDEYYNKNREDVIQANKVLNGYAALVNVRSLIKFYEDQHDSLPKGNLYELFKDEEDMKEIRKDLSSDPYINIGEEGYTIEAKALNDNQTPVSLNIEFVNTYEDVIEESFSKGPYYYTNDSNTTFFIVVKAKDESQTIITTRPKFREEERRL
jgi:hypothetical protein